MAVELEQFRAALNEWPAFAASEYERRAQVAHEAMAAEGVDLFFAADPATVCYFTGFDTLHLLDMCALVLRSEEEPLVVLNDQQMPRWEASAGFGETATYADGSDPTDVVVEVLTARRNQSYAIDDWAPYHTERMQDRIRAALDGVVRRDARPILWATRLRKSPAEISVMREAARITDLGIAAAVDAAVPGATDFDLVASAAEAMLRAGSGSFPMHPIVAVGPRAGVMHSEAASGRALQEGEGAFLEFTASVHRYNAPLMRTVTVGEPSPRLVELASVASRAVETIVASLRVGVPCADVAAAVMSLISREAPEVFFHGYAGYAVGLSFPPCWEENLLFTIHESNSELIDEGMVFHLPITLREQGVLGVGLSYTVVVTSEGSEVLSGTPAELIRR